ncbi:MarR family transcriptional regulator [Candidatus Woesearchaeota archaeon]|nr:MarR family transcriptional regulator [Candidatus Woesearchaeota archaeon]
MTNQKFLGLGFGIGALLVFVLLLLYKAELDQRNLQFCEAACQQYEEVCTAEACPFMDHSYSWVFSLLLAISLMLSLAGFGLFLFQKKAIMKRKEPTGLTTEEQQIYQLIKVSGTPCYQSALVEKSGLSKVKVTRILHKLEAKGVLERKRKGMTNIVVLK